MKVLSKGQKVIIVELSRSEFEGITGRKIKTGYCYGGDILESEIEGLELNLIEFIDAVFEMKCAVECRNKIIDNVDDIKERVSKMLFPVGIKGGEK